MPSALSRIAAIASLRGGPEELPASGQLLLMVIGADLLISVVGISSALPLAAAFAVAGLSIGLGIVFTYLVLYLRGLSARFWQTATALFGTDALISLVALPLSLTLANYVGAEGGAEDAPPALALALLGILVWSISVVSKIFREALQQSRLAGFLIGLAYVFLTSGIAF